MWLSRNSPLPRGERNGRGQAPRALNASLNETDRLPCLVDEASVFRVGGQSRTTASSHNIEMDGIAGDEVKPVAAVNEACRGARHLLSMDYVDMNEAKECTGSCPRV